MSSSPSSDTLPPAAADVVLILDVDGQILYYNAPARYGVGPHDVIGQRLDALLPAAAAQRILAQNEQVIAHDATAFVQDEIEWQGQTLRFNVRVDPLHDRTGRISGVVRVAQDVTDLQQVERALYDSEQRYRALFEDAPIGIYRTTPDGRIVNANPALVRMLGYASFKELRKRNLEQEGFEPSYPRSVFRHRIETAGQVIGLESAWTRRDGSTIYVRENARAIRDESAQIVCYEGTVEDITERKRIEHQADRERRLFARGPVVVFRWVPHEDWPVDYVSSNCTTLLGYNPDDFTAGRVRYGDLIHPDDHKRRVEESAGGRDEPHIEQDYRIVRPFGDVRWLHDYTVPVRNVHGRIIFYEGYVFDVTARKIVETELRQSEERLRRLIESAEDIIALHDAEGRYLYFSGPSRYGVAAADLLGKTPADLFPAPQAEAIMAQIARVAATGETLNVENTVQWQGETLWFADEAFPIRDQRGQITGVGKICRNITKQKHAAERLAESEQRFRLLFECAPVGYQSLDERGHLLAVNKRWLATLGYQREEVIGRWFGDFLAPEFVDGFRERFAEFRQTGEVHGVEFDVLHKSGARIAVSFEGQIARDASGHFVQTHCVMHNLTERRRAELEVQQARAFLETVLNGVSAEIAIVDHHGSITAVNDAWRRFAEKNGFRGRDHGIGSNYLEVCQAAHGPSSEGAAEAAAGLEAVLAGQVDTHYQEYPCHSNGQQRWFQLRVRRATFGGRTWAITAHEDITEVKQAENAWRISEQRYRTVADFTFDWETWTAPDGGYLFTSPSCERLTGYPPQAFLEDPQLVEKITHPDDRAMVAEHHQAELASREAMEADFRIITRDGAVRWIAHACVPVYDDQGGYLGRRGSNRDTTRRRRTEDALRSRDAILLAVSGIAEQFLHAGGWQENMHDAWARLGEAAHVSRVYAFENATGADGRLITRCRSEWDAPGVSSICASVENGAFCFEELGLQRWVAELGAGEVIAGTVGDLPPAEQALLLRHGVRSIALVPVRVDDEWWGFIGLDDCERERTWSPAEIGALQAAASTLAAAIRRKRVANERERLVAELQAAMAKVRTLHGMLPICASCKRIRDDQGYWEQIEVYIRDHADVEFSHGLCPDCMKALYPEFDDEGA